MNGVSEQVRLDHKAPAKVKKELPKEKNFTVPDHDVKPSRVMAYLIKTRGIGSGNRQGYAAAQDDC